MTWDRIYGEIQLDAQLRLYFTVYPLVIIQIHYSQMKGTYNTLTTLCIALCPLCPLIIKHEWTPSIPPRLLADPRDVSLYAWFNLYVPVTGNFVTLGFMKVCHLKKLYLCKKRSKTTIQSVVCDICSRTTTVYQSLSVCTEFMSLNRNIKGDPLYCLHSCCTLLLRNLNTQLNLLWNK